LGQIALPGLAKGQNLQITLADEEAEKAILTAISAQQEILMEEAPAIEIRGLEQSSEIDKIIIDLNLDDDID